MTPVTEVCITKQPKGLSVFEKYLTVWVLACIGAGILLGKLAPGLAKTLDGIAVYTGGAPVISIPIAVCLFFMMYPIMVKIDFAEVIKAGRSGKPVGLTLVMVAINSLTMLLLYGPRKARGAVARKLLVAVWYVLTGQQPCCTRSPEAV